MFDGISDERLLSMTTQEQRWLDNIKKAFHESDLAFMGGQPETRCMEELCKAVDTAKTLRRSLRGETTDNGSNKKRFIEFLELEIPGRTANGFDIRLLDARSGGEISYSFAELVYAVRCMIHENENLNAAEKPDYHILLDWTAHRRSSFMGTIRNGRLTCNAERVWRRLREVLSKFIMGLEAQLEFAQGNGFSIRIDPPLGTIRPFESTQSRNL